MGDSVYSKDAYGKNPSIVIKVLKIISFILVILLEILITFPGFTVSYFLFYTPRPDSRNRLGKITFSKIKENVKAKTIRNVVLFLLIGSVMYLPAILAVGIFPPSMLAFVIIFVCYLIKEIMVVEDLSEEKVNKSISDEKQGIKILKLVTGVFMGVIIMIFLGGLLGYIAYVTTVWFVSFIDTTISAKEYPLGRMGGMSIIIWTAPKTVVVLGVALLNIKKIQYIAVGLMVSPIVFLILSGLYTIFTEV